MRISFHGVMHSVLKVSHMRCWADILDRIVRSTTFLLSPAILHELEALVDEQALGSRIREISLEFAGFVWDRAFRFAQRKYDDVFNEDYYLVRSYPLLDNERGMYENFVTGVIEKLIEDKVDEAKGVMRDYMGYVSYDNSTIFSSSSESEQE